MVSSRPARPLKSNGCHEVSSSSCTGSIVVYFFCADRTNGACTRSYVSKPQNVCSLPPCTTCRPPGDLFLSPRSKQAISDACKVAASSGGMDTARPPWCAGGSCSRLKSARFSAVSWRSSSSAGADVIVAAALSSALVLKVRSSQCRTFTGSNPPGSSTSTAGKDYIYARIVFRVAVKVR